MSTEKLKKCSFKVKDNFGNILESKEYEWTKENGIPCEEKILEDMEVCNCGFNESVNHCEGDCIRFDEGEVINIIWNTRKTLSVEEIADIIKSRLDCPNCDNVGYMVREISVHQCNGDDDTCQAICPRIEHEQEQCEFCYTEENSKFNLDKAIHKAITQE